jgi:hypothetical protein
MTETSAAAYMASNCSFAPTGPASRLAASGKARRSSREHPRNSTGLRLIMARLYKILYLLTSWIGTTAQATLLSVRLFRPLRASLPRKPIVGAGFPLRADPASSNFADPRSRAQGFALSFGLLRLAFLDAPPPSTPPSFLFRLTACQNQVIFMKCLFPSFMNGGFHENNRNHISKRRQR